MAHKLSMYFKGGQNTDITYIRENCAPAPFVLKVLT